MTSPWRQTSLSLGCLIFLVEGACAGGAGAPPATVGATNDAGTPAADAAPSCAGAFVCDNFESYPVGSVPTSPWSVAKTAGSLAIDTTRAFSGQQSVKVTAPAASGYQSVMLRLASASVLPTPGNVIYGRMMFWLDSSPSMQVHWTFIDGEGLVPGTTYHAVERYGGQVPIAGPDGGFLGNELMASYDTPDSYNGVGPSSDCYQHSQGTIVPVGVWACAEWEFDGVDNTMRFWLNGEAQDDLTVAQSGEGCTQQPTGYVWAAPQFARIDLGWEAYQADDARTLWLDDVAVGTERLGCP